MTRQELELLVIAMCRPTHMSALLKAHDYTAILLPVLIYPVSDVSVVCYCIYVPSNDISDTGCFTGSGDETAK